MLPRRRTTMPPFEVMGHPSPRAPRPPATASGASTDSSGAAGPTDAVGAAGPSANAATGGPHGGAASDEAVSVPARDPSSNPPRVLSRAPRDRTPPAPGLGVGRAVLVRIAPGWLVLTALGVVTLVLVAFWLGHVRGYDKRVAEDRQQEEMPRRLAPAPPAVTGDLSLREAMGAGTKDGGLTAGRQPSRDKGLGATGKLAPPTGAGSLLSGAGARTTDPKRAAGADVGPEIALQREIGRNYLVLAQYSDPAEANRLSAFLRRHAVEAAVVSAHNGRLFVVDLMGFDAAEMRQRNGAYEQRKALLRRLGRAWRDQEKGPTDLSDMWPEKYTGEKAVPGTTPTLEKTTTPGKKRESS